MISIDKLIQQLQQCKDTSVTLPKMNDTLFTQKTAIEIRKTELELLDTNFTKLNEANYTIEYKVEEPEKIQSTIEKSHYTKETKDTNIPNKSLIIYSENNTCNIPEIIINLFSSNIFKISEWYIYGVKNPESFYKSFLLLFKTDFIIKNKTETKNEVTTFKREMAIQYETFYKKLNYRKLHFPRNDMINNLTNTDNYTEYDLLQYISDYNKVNYIILDIINEKYIDIKYISDTDNTDYFIIIKYASNTYLPLMNSNGNHYFNIKILDIISKNFERTVFPKFKEPSNDCNDVNDVNDSVANNTTSDTLEYSYNIEESLDIPITTISYDSNILNFDSLIKSESSLNNISNTNSINSNNISIDIIDIEEEENEPLGFKNTASTKCNSIDSLMLNIPMASDIKLKKTKKQIALDEKNAKLEKKVEPKVETKVEPKVEPNNDTKEELKPLEKYNLVDLQFLAKFHKIDTQKMGNCNKKINKLKAELYEEIKKKM